MEPPAEGTRLFASLVIHAARAARPRPCDDLESLCYCLAFLGSGGLPWERCESCEEVAELKAAVTAEGLSEGFDDERARAAVTALWAEVLRARGRASGAIDYDACSAAFGDSSQRAGGLYDWEQSVRELASDLERAVGEALGSRDGA